MAFLDRRGLVGHCVIRRNPWHFLGIYATRGEAERQAKQAGEDYEVVFGTHREGTADVEALDRDQDVQGRAAVAPEHG